MFRGVEMSHNNRLVCKTLGRILKDDMLRNVNISHTLEAPVFS